MSRLKIFTASEIKAFDKPPKLSAKQRQQAFALTENVISTISRLRSPENKVAFLLSLGYFRVSGRFFSPSDFHRSDIVAASKILNLNPADIDLSDYQGNHRRHLEHKKLVLNLLGFSAFNRDAKKILQEIISKLAEHDGDPREMIYHAWAQLHQQNIEIPAYDTFLRLITDALNQVEHQYEDIIAKHINQEQEALLDDLIYTDEDTHFARLNQWKVISQSERPAKIQASVSVYNDIKRLFLQLLPLMDKLALSDNAIRYYSGWVERSMLSQLKQLKATERYLRLIAFIQSQMYLRQDYLMDTLIKSAKTCRNNAMGKNQKTNQGQQSKRNTAINKLISGHTNLKEFYEKIKEIIFNHAINEKEKLTLIQNLVESSENKKIIDPEDAKKILTGMVNNNHYYEALESGFTKLKNRVEAIILSMNFDEPSSCKNLLSAIEHYRKFKLGSKKIDSNSPTQFLESEHVKQLTDSERKFRPQLYKTLLFLYVADGVKHGKLNLSHSYRYRALGEYLIDSKIWEENKDALIKAAGIDHLKDIRQLIS